MAEFGAAPTIDAKDPPVVKLLKTADAKLAFAELVLVAAALTFLVAVGFYRSVFDVTKGWKALHAVFPVPPEWTNNAILSLVFVIGLLGLALAAQSDRLIAIDIFSRVITPRVKLVFRIIGNAFAIYVSYYFIKSALHFRAAQEGLYDSTPKLLSDRTTQLMFPITSVLLMVHLALKIALDGIALATGRLPPGLTPAEAAIHHVGVDPAAVKELKAKEPGEETEGISPRKPAPEAKPETKVEAKTETKVEPEPEPPAPSSKNGKSDKPKGDA